MIPSAKRALAALALAALLPGTALAAGSGAAIPETGGQGAGAASADAKGLAANPAAASGVGGSEGTLDLALMMLWVQYKRAPYDGTDTPADPDRTFRSVESFNAAAVPYAAFRSDAPFGGKNAKLGLGASVSVPFGRLVHFSPDYPGRYHLVTVDYSTVYATPVVSFRATRHLRLGAGPVVGLTKVRLRQRLDLAPTIQEIAPGDPPPPPESGLLEGEILVREAEGTSYGFTLGGILDLGERATLGLSFLSYQQSKARGRSKLTPSRDLTLYTTGDFTLTQNLPPIVNAGVRYRTAGKPLEFSFEGQWVGWSVNRYFHLEIENSEIASENHDMQTMLDFLAAQGFDLNEGQVVENIFDKDQYLARKYQNAWNFIAGMELGFRENMRSRLQVGFDKGAIPDATANIGNVDFDALVLGAGITWAPKKRPVEVGVAYSQYLNAGRNVKKSAYATHGTPVEYAYPSGEGTYSALLSRLALNVAYRF